MDAQRPFEFDQPYTLLWRTLTMRSSHLLVAVVALTLSLGSWSYAQNETPDGATSRQPQQERPNRPRRDQIDPSTDEVLQTIRAAVQPTDEQMEQIVARYRQLRRDQRSAMREMRGELRRGGQRPRDRDGQQGRNRQSRRGMMEKMRAVLEPINAQFLADSRAILDASRQEAWDGCAAGLDLTPQRGRGGRGGLDPATGPNVGDEAPDFELTDLDENKLSLSSLRGKPVVIEFGSYTCPVFRRKVNDLAALRSEYGDDVQWIMIYTLEAHPTDGRVAPVNTRAGIEIPQHTSFEKRLECAKLCAEKLDLKLHVLVDGFENKVTDAYGGRPNRGYVLDAEGKVVSKQVWIEVGATRTALDAILPQRKDSDKPTPTTKPS